MVIKSLENIPYTTMEAYPGVDKKIVIGPDDGSKEIIMRLFKLGKGQSTPYHNHGFPHVVKVESGSGVYVDMDKNEHPISSGNVLYVPDDEMHCFKNVGDVDFEFVCIVPERGEG